MRALAILCVLALSGCASREAARAALYSDTAIAAAAAKVAELPGRSAEDQAREVPAILDLLGAGRQGLAPVIARLSAGERTQPTIGWTPAQAAAEPARFAAAAARQAGRADIEAEEAAAALDTLRTAVAGVGEGLSGLLLGGGTAAGALAGLLAMLRRISQWKEAARQAATFAADAAQAAEDRDPEALERAREKAARDQERAGVRHLVRRVRPAKPKPGA